MKTLKEQLTSVNESVKIIDEERDYVCIHDSNIAKKDACCVMIDSTRDRSKSLSDDERKIVKDFCQQYDFKLTDPNHAYCMWLYLDK